MYVMFVYYFGYYFSETATETEKNVGKRYRSVSLQTGFFPTANDILPSGSRRVEDTASCSPVVENLLLSNPDKIVTSIILCSHERTDNCDTCVKVPHRFIIGA